MLGGHKIWSWKKPVLQGQKQTFGSTLSFRQTSKLFAWADGNALVVRTVWKFSSKQKWGEKNDWTQKKLLHQANKTLFTGKRKSKQTLWNTVRNYHYNLFPQEFACLFVGSFVLFVRSFVCLPVLPTRLFQPSFPRLVSGVQTNCSNFFFTWAFTRKRF